jgi:hypothetical protein
MERDEKENLCLSAIYIDFSKYLSPKEPCVSYCKENSRTSFFQVGVFDVGRNLVIFSVKTKIEKMSKIILEQGRLIINLPVFRQWKYKRKDLIVNSGFYFIFLFTIKTLFPLLTRIRFALFISFPY